MNEEQADKPQGYLPPRKLDRREVLTRGSLALLPLAVGGVFGCGKEIVTSSVDTRGTVLPSTFVSPFNGTQVGYGLNHYLVTGQSLSSGEHGFFGVSNAQPFNNRMFGPDDIFNFPTLGSPSVSLVPLISGPQSRETIGNGFADSLTAQAQQVFSEFPGGPTSYDLLVSNSGQPGYTYAQLAGPADFGGVGSPPFQEMMSQVAWGKRLAASLGLTYRVAAMIVIHGEFDSLNPDYSTNLSTWQSDMQNGVQTLTGQVGTIPMIAAQTQCFVNSNTFLISGSYGTLTAAMANPSKIFLACPEYAMQHHFAGETGPTAGYTIHMTADGYRHLGQMMAKAARVVTMEGGSWVPLMPTSTKFLGNKIVVEHSVPHPPLMFDMDWVSDPGNRGYSYVDNVDPGITITDAVVTSPTAVTITLSKATSGGTLGYANFAPPSDPSYVDIDGGKTTDYGPTRGPRGCLRDSDPAVAFYTPSTPYYMPSAGGANHYPMQNYCVAYQRRVGTCIGAEANVVAPNWRC